MSALDELQHLTLEDLCELFAERLAPRLVQPADEVLTAAELAQRIGMSRGYVYANAHRLGAIRIGSGPRPRLVFRWPAVLDRLEDVPPERDTTPPVDVRRRRKQRGHSDLLPVRGATVTPPRGIIGT